MGGIQPLILNQADYSKRTKVTKSDPSQRKGRRVTTLGDPKAPKAFLEV